MLGAYGVTHGVDAGDDSCQLRLGRNRGEASCDVHLEGGEALLDPGDRLVARLGGFVATYPGVHADLVAHGTTDQLVHGYAPCLPCYVPECLVYPGDGA